MSMATNKPLGVIVVSYASSDVILECLQSLLASEYQPLRIVVVDNASPDNSCELVRKFAVQNSVDFTETSPEEFQPRNSTSPKHLNLITSSENTGYAGGVNLGLNFLMKSLDVDSFWVLNPDSVVQPDTATTYANAMAKAGTFGLLAGRTLYFGEAGMIQSDGGWVNLWTGVCHSINQGKMRDDVTMPDLESVNFLSGANFIASRSFVKQVGYMKEDYFLYYEEVDWAMRRGKLPLALCPQAIVLHHGGTAIGSGTTRRLPSAFSNYFNYRNRMIFVRRFRPIALPVAYVYSLLKIVKLLLQGARTEANGAWRGLNFLAPTKLIAGKIDQAAHKRAFGRNKSR